MTDASHTAHFKDILRNAQRGDNAKIKEAEHQLKQMKDADLLAFVQSLMMVVSEVPAQSPDENEQVRMLAAILFKNSLYQGVFGNDG